MEIDQAAWVVHRHVVDPCLDELDLPADAHVSLHPLSSDFGRSPIMPIDLPADLWGLDTEALQRLARDTRSLLAAADEVSSAG